MMCSKCFITSAESKATCVMRCLNTTVDRFLKEIKATFKVEKVFETWNNYMNIIQLIILLIWRNDLFLNGLFLETLTYQSIEDNLKIAFSKLREFCVQFEWISIVEKYSPSHKKLKLNFLYISEFSVYIKLGKWIKTYVYVYTKNFDSKSGKD